MDLPGVRSGAQHPDARRGEPAGQTLGELAPGRVGDAQEDHRRERSRPGSGHRQRGFYGRYPSPPFAGGLPDLILFSALIRSVPPPRLPRASRRAPFRAPFPAALVAGILLPILVPLGGCPAPADLAGRSSETPPAAPTQETAAPTQETAATTPETAATPGAAPAADASDARPRLIAFGDSLTAGYGIEVSEAWPARLQELLDAGGFAFRVVNAGVSGETTSGGRRRLPWLLDREPGAALIVIALGGNDGLRGIPAPVMRENLREMVREAQERGLGVLLAGVPAPPELGRDYEAEFRAVFGEVAAGTGAGLLDSILAGVAGVPEWNQRDGIHPNPEGARRLADNVLAALRPLLAEAAATSEPGWEPGGPAGVSAPR